MKKNITKTAVDQMKTPPEGSKTRITDNRLRGFVAIKYPSRRVQFAIEYLSPISGKQRRYAFGDLGEYTVKEARTEAENLMGRLRAGKDPLDEAAADRAAPTWSKWVDEYIVDVKRRKKHPMDDVWFLRGTTGGRGGKNDPEHSEAMKRWESRKLHQISPRDVENLLSWTADNRGKIRANREYASIRACFEAACRAGLLEHNPAARVRKLPENAPRQRVLSGEELTRLREAVAELPNDEERVLMEVLLGTGCRRSEALNMKWDDLDFDAGIWTIPSPKSGRPQSLPLTSRVATAIRSLEARSEMWVFPGPDPSRPRRDIRKLWKDLKTQAKLKDVNIHDIRRTYGLAVARKAGILAAQKLLRHSSPAVTAAVYTPLAAEELRGVAEQVTGEADVAHVEAFRKASDS